MEKEKFINLLDKYSNKIDIMFNDRDDRLISNSDYIINIDIVSSNVFNVKKIKDCYNKGYIETISNIRKLKEIL